MKNLKSMIQYECMTSFKYIWIFYAIQYAMVGIITIIVGISMGSLEDGRINCLETNTLIYVGILGMLGFNEDFKMLIQNGFTRKYILIATFSMFCFISGTMALVDTVAGNSLHYLYSSYSSLYSRIYGYGNLFMNWLWLFFVYVSICSLLYLVILVINKVEKTTSIYLGIVLGGIVLLTVSLFRYVLSAEAVNNISGFLMKAIGFMTDGSLNYLFPISFLLVLVAILETASYASIRRIELK